MRKLLILIAFAAVLSGQTPLISPIGSGGGGGGGTPGGASLTVQYNNAGAFGGMVDSSWTAATRTLQFLDANTAHMLVFSANPCSGNPFCGGVIFNIGCDLAAPATVGTTPGTRAGYIEFDGAPGGNTSIATTGVGGVGSGAILNGGAGGTAPAAVTASTGGAGGTVQVAGQVGGSASNAANVGTNVGGAGGDVTITAGVGGAAANGASNTGGRGGNVTITPGAGGDGATADGADGNIILPSVAGMGTRYLTVNNGGNLGATASAGALPAGSANDCQFNGGGGIFAAFTNNCDYLPTAVAVPASVVITQGGADNGVSYRYCVAWIRGGVGLPTCTTTTHGPTALSGMNTNIVTPSACPAGVSYFLLWRTVGGTDQGLLNVTGLIPNPAFQGYSCATQIPVTDDGTGDVFADNPPSIDTTTGFHVASVTFPALPPAMGFGGTKPTVIYNNTGWNGLTVTANDNLNSTYLGFEGGLQLIANVYNDGSGPFNPTIQLGYGYGASDPTSMFINSPTKIGIEADTKLEIFSPETTASGTFQAGGYKSSDGSAGVSVAVCTAFKNGLCTAGM